MVASNKKARPAWESYNDSADAYDKYAAPGCFTDVARDLVAALGLTRGEHVLDVGSGTGVVAAAACEAVLPGGRVTALDMSAEMLTHAPPETQRVTGEVPGLPYPEGSFDAVCASFVLSHCDDHKAALRDMVRVARAGGKVGVTAWGEADNEFDALWGEVAARFVDPDAMKAAQQSGRPWTDWLRDENNLRSTLEEAGLESVSIMTSQYVTDATMKDFFEHKALFLTGRFIRLQLADDAWARFNAELVSAFRRNYEDGRVRFATPAHVAVGRKPA
jgi:ubiquinone/menaquinone biosynthesis C-methylase UbiE